MRIKPVTDQPLFTGQRVNEKKDADGQRRQPGQDDSRQESDAERRKPTFEVTEAEVRSAIEGFSQDAQAQAFGLTAAQEGEGPGLRVVLKDGHGAVIRQLTGEEFIKIREKVAEQKATRGKILDQKL